MKCVIVKTSKFIKQQDTRRLLISSETEAPLSKIPWVGFLLFLRVLNKLIQGMK